MKSSCTFHEVERGLRSQRRSKNTWTWLAAAIKEDQEIRALVLGSILMGNNKLYLKLIYIYTIVLHHKLIKLSWNFTGNSIKSNLHELWWECHKKYTGFSKLRCTLADILAYARAYLLCRWRSRWTSKITRCPNEGFESSWCKSYETCYKITRENKKNQILIDGSVNFITVADIEPEKKKNKHILY